MVGKQNGKESQGDECDEVDIIPDEENEEGSTDYIDVGMAYQ